MNVELANPYWFYPRALVQRQTCRHAQPVPTQPALFQCADERWVYFALILVRPKPWKALVEWMDSHGLAIDLTDPAFDDLVYRQENFPHIQDLVEVFFLLQDSTGLSRGTGARPADRPAQRARRPVRRRAPAGPRVLRTCRRARVRRGSHAGRRIPVLDDVHRCAPNRLPGSARTRPKCSARSRRRRDRPRAGRRCALRRRSHPRSRRFPLPGVRHGDISARVVPEMRRSRRRALPTLAPRGAVVVHEQRFPPKTPYLAARRRSVRSAWDTSSWTERCTSRAD